MKKYFILLAITLFFFLMPKSVLAVNYYVSTTGNDTNLGTLSYPWKTIQKAAATLTAGNTVIVKSGNYTGTITLSQSGDSTHRIIFQGEAGTKLSGQLKVYGSYITIKAFEITGVDPGGTDPWAPCIQIHQNNVEISDSTITHCFSSGVYLLPTSSYGIVKNNRITDSVSDGISIDGQYQLIENNYIGHIRNYYREGTAYRGEADGIHFFGSHHIIRNNTIEDLNHKYTKYTPSNTCNDTTAQTNAECWTHIDCFQGWNGTNVAISDILFEGNTCRLSRSYLPSGVPLDTLMVKFFMLQRTANTPVDNIVFRNNFFINESYNGWTPINIGNVACQATLPIEAVSIYNNTFVKTTGEGFMGVLLRCINGIDIKNNLFIDFGNASHSYIYSSNDVSGITIDHNAVYKTNGKAPVGGPYQGDNIPSLWMQDPKIVSLSAGNLHLNSNSSLINAGVTLPSVLYDIDGNSRPQPQGSSYDIG
ncbi:DUF1565 domain-containing protein, partial [Candidatus Microgenomates bacterium]|nr:DUF1565 domain-containing protein [Candidatus Microgenomates bacterium]